MKYIMFSFVVIITISYNMLQFSDAKINQHSKIQIHGKVHGLRGNMILNIQDSYLTLNTLDRFTLLVKVTNQDKLTMLIVDKPKDQQCEIIKSANSNHIVRIDIYCQIISNVI